MSYIGKKPTDVPIEASDINSTIITGQVAEASIADDDLILISDTSASAIRKMTKANFVSGVGGGGKIGQVISTNKTDTFSESVNTEVFSGIATGLTVAITPSATSSKVLVIVHAAMGIDGGSTQIDLGAASSSRARLSKGPMQNGGAGSYMMYATTNFLDSPSSTSELTYGIKIGHTSGSAKTMYLNRSHDDPDDASYGRNASTITVMEVLA